MGVIPLEATPCNFNFLPSIIPSWRSCELPMRSHIITALREVPKILCVTDHRKVRNVFFIFLENVEKQYGGCAKSVFRFPFHDDNY
jgi:hypothetical protein